MKHQENHLWHKRNKDESGYKVEQLEITSLYFFLRPNEDNDNKYECHD